MTSRSAPIAVFAYNRPDHLQLTLQSLVACEGFDDAPVTIFIDGPKNEAGAQTTKQVRQVALRVLGESADIRVSATNQGLSKSIVAGVGELVARHGKVIVVEDDLILAPPFLEFMNAALNRYQSNDNVYQITGFMFDIPELADQEEAIFLPMVSTWGWATWDRAWKVFDANATGWGRMRQDRQLRRRFNFDGAYPYSWLMERQQRGRSDSWGVRWYWSVFQRDGVTLFPPVSMVRNTGQDGSGTHGGGLMADFETRPEISVANLPKLPEFVAVKEANRALVKNALWRQNGAWKGWLFQNMRHYLGL